MKWLQSSPTYRLSECNNYKIAKYHTKEGYRYLLWKNTGKRNTYGDVIWEQIGEAAETFNQAEGFIDAILDLRTNKIRP